MKRTTGIVYTITVALTSLILSCAEPTIEPSIEEQRSEQKMNDFTVKPIEEYPAYYEVNGKIYGLDPAVRRDNLSEREISVTIDVDGKEFKPAIKDFMVVDGVVLFQVSHTFPAAEEGAEPETVTKYCSQTGGKITYIDPADFPPVPAAVRYEGDDGTLSVTVGEYEGDAISVLTREYAEPMIFVDGVYRIGGGYLVSAPKGRGSARPDGLLYWPDCLRSMTKWAGIGRMWIK